MKSEGSAKEITEITDRWFGRTVGAKTRGWTEEKIGNRTDGKIDGLAAKLTLPAHILWHALANMLIKDILKRSRTEYGAVSFN